MTTAARPTGRDVAYRGFRGALELAAGTLEGLRTAHDGLVLDAGVEQVSHHGVRYDSARWTSPPVRPGFPVTELIPSWTAATPGGCWIEMAVRGWTGTGQATDWYPMARWAAGDEHLRRTSLAGPGDGRCRVRTDTLTAGPDGPLAAWQLRVTLLRPAGTALRPVLRSAGAVACGPAVPAPPAPAAGPARGRVLDVPCFSQRTHAGHYPEWGGGGDSWCSPTCTSMVLAYWRSGPGPEEYAWVAPGDPNPVIDHAARACYDHAYGGAGNWPFNTAYAGRYGLDAFVTRLRSLAEAEAFIGAGVPLVLSAAYRKGDIPGLDYDTRGHLMVLVGFTGTGDPVLNDPYSPDDATVRKTVDRARLEAAWQGGSGGMVYVIRPPDVPLPAAPAQANW